MTDEDATIRARWTGALAALVTRSPRAVVATSIVLGLLGALLGWFRLPLDANTDSLISRDREWMKGYLNFLAEYGDLEYLYVVVDTKGHRAEAEAAVDELTASLRRLPDLPGIHGRIEPAEQWVLTSRAASDEELKGLADAASGLRELASGDNWLGVAAESLREVAQGQLVNMPEAEARERGASAFLLLDAVASVGEAARGDEPSLGLARSRPPEYLASDTGRLLFISILPRKDFSTLAAIERPLAEIRAVIEEVQARHPTVDIGLTGKPVLQADELMTSTGDTTMSFAVGLVVVAILCVILYRDWRRPLLALIAFACAIGWTQGAAALLVGRLTLLSMVFMLVLIGAGLDYGIHIVSRYTESRATMSVADAVRNTLRTAAAGTITGAITSAAVFVLAIFSSFGGLRELGIIAGSGLVLCAVAMVTTLPALLVLMDSNRQPRQAIELRAPFLSVGHESRSARVAILVCVLLGAAALAAVPVWSRFESNLLKLQAQDLESVGWERRVLADSASLSWFGAVSVSTEPAALDVITRARAEPEIGAIRSVFDLVRPSTPERDALRARLAGAAADLPPPPTDPVRSWPPPTIMNAVQQLRLMATLAGGRMSDEQRMVTKALADRLEACARAPFDPKDPEARARRDAAFARVQAAARDILAGSTLQLRDSLPEAVRARYVSPRGMLLIQLIPSGDTWELEPLERFVAAMRRVDPAATGVPITQSESIHDMTRAFVSISLLSVVAVALITWIDFRSLFAVALCTGTLLVGILLTLGTLAALGIPLSLANFFGIPILIGLGIDSNIHLLHRARESRQAGADRVELGATRSAVVFTSLTTAIGFGGQVFASHQGMRGLGWIMVVGSLVCLAVSLWLLPAILRLSWERERRRAVGGTTSGPSPEHESRGPS